MELLDGTLKLRYCTDPFAVSPSVLHPRSVLGLAEVMSQLLVVVGVETGGRWSDEAASTISLEHERPLPSFGAARFSCGDFVGRACSQLHAGERSHSLVSAAEGSGVRAQGAPSSGGTCDLF